MNSMLKGPDFKLGLFAANCSSGSAVTKAPDRWSGSWADNVAAAKIADEVGLDFLLPVARWIGYGGESNYHNDVLDPTTWMAGLLSVTKNINIFSTVHTAFTHPLVAAKQFATADQIGNGRAGINIVAGWNKTEFDAFGIELPLGHDDRYERAQEWWDVINKVWSTAGRFDHAGKFFKLKGVEGMPKPVHGRIPVINAGSSEQGRDYAAKNADFIFTVVDNPTDGAEVVKSISDNAKNKYQRKSGVLTLGHVVCRPTNSQVDEFIDYYANKNADWVAVDNMMALMGQYAKSFTPEMLATYRTRFAAGDGSCPLTGTPDEVADRIYQFAKAGFSGMTIAFFDYTKELPYFAQEVLPRLVSKGIRIR